MYHTLGDLKNLIPERDLKSLVDDEVSGDPIVEDPPNVLMERVTAAGQRAQNAIDAACRGRYTVPLSPVPDIIVDISAGLTICNLYDRKLDLVPSDALKIRLGRANDLLDQIQRGLIKLYDDLPAPPHYVSNKTSRDKFFSRDRLNQF